MFIAARFYRSIGRLGERGPQEGRKLLVLPGFLADDRTTLGLQRAFYGPDKWLDILSEEPLLLRTPLVRFGQKVTIGAAEDAWQEWIDADKAS